MKITKLNIKNHQQFKDLVLDFTYPKGHVNAGEPLKKVCFIGQSGTGKTTLLNFVREQVDSELNGDFIVENERAETLGNIEYVIQDFLFLSNKIVHRRDGSYVDERGVEVKLVTDAYKNGKSLVYLTTTVESTEKGLFVKPDQKTDKEVISKNDRLDLSSLDFDDFFDDVLSQYNRSRTLVLDSNLNQKIWKFMLKDIDDFDIKLRNKGAELIQKGTSKMSVEKTLKELEKWKKENPNPRIELAEKCLNKILHKFYLDIDTENLESYISIKPQTAEHAINYTGLSTGTKQILLTALPIFKYASDKIIYLFDEPERSLFPDLQQMLVDYYVSLAPDAQFFFATHSPVIASQFEPCERFILYFDETGKVRIKNGVAPQGDDPNDILKKDFGMQHLMTSKGLEMYNRYLKLISQSRKVKDDEDKRKLLDEIADIAESYNY